MGAESSGCFGSPRTLGDNGTEIPTGLRSWTAGKAIRGSTGWGTAPLHGGSRSRCARADLLRGARENIRPSLPQPVQDLVRVPLLLHRGHRLAKACAREGV